MKETVNQGDIVKIERIRSSVLVTSKDFFNQTGEIIGCPVFQNSSASPLHIKIRTDSTEGYVQCEKLALIDLNDRDFSKTGRISMTDIIEITDAIQSIFDYV